MDRQQRPRTSNSPTAAASFSPRGSTSWTSRSRLVEQVRQTQSRFNVGRHARGLASPSR
ncbi:MAG TPA: hypothetical protein VKB25_09935 [Conexibacter sp.]|nr:hypothetical protein [Conexibacter sp.]